MVEMGQTLEVYRNLNLAKRDPSKFVWSLRAPRGKVIGHATEITLENVEFVVRENARLRICRGGPREVHAWAKGRVISDAVAERREFDIAADVWVPISYNPKKASEFYRTDNGAPVVWARHVHFTRHGAFAVL